VILLITHHIVVGIFYCWQRPFDNLLMNILLFFSEILLIIADIFIYGLISDSPDEEEMDRINKGYNFLITIGFLIGIQCIFFIYEFVISLRNLINPNAGDKNLQAD
jgi:hypothetical protein